MHSILYSCPGNHDQTKTTALHHSSERIPVMERVLDGNRMPVDDFDDSRHVFCVLDLSFD
jgi:hypothetical protein